MTVKAHTYVTIACDVCGEDFSGMSDVGMLHYPDEASAASDALEHDWFANTAGNVLCGDGNDAHLKLALGLLPTLRDGEVDDLLTVYPQLETDDDDD